MAYVRETQGSEARALVQPPPGEQPAEQPSSEEEERAKARAKIWTPGGA